MVKRKSIVRTVSLFLIGILLLGIMPASAAETKTTRVGVAISQGIAEIKPGGTLQLSVQVDAPSEVTEKPVWKSSNKNIATVDQNGLVTGVALGNCEISVELGTAKAVCLLTVTQNPAQIVYGSYGTFQYGV